MADDDVTIKDASDATETIATDFVGGKQYQYIKLAWGPNDVVNLVDVGTPIPVQPVAGTLGGCSTYMAISNGSDIGAAAVKGSAGNVYGWQITNKSTAWRFVKLFNKATTPNPASDSALVKCVLGIPPGGGAAPCPALGIAFATGIGIAVTVNEATNDGAIPSANDVVVNLFFK